MKRLSIACVAALAAVLSACSGDSFESQAESAVRQQFLAQIHQLSVQWGDGSGTEGLAIENFQTSDCNDQGSQRMCNVSFQISAIEDGKKEVMPEPIEGKAVFMKSDDQWTLLSLF